MKKNIRRCRSKDKRKTIALSLRHCGALAEMQMQMLCFPFVSRNSDGGRVPNANAQQEPARHQNQFSRCRPSICWLSAHADKKYK